jgi:anti-anti-sigma factor
MTIQTKQEDKAVVVAVSGRLDAVTAPEYAKTVQELIRAGMTRMVADLDQLTYISSNGLGELIMTAKMLKEKSGRFCVANVHGNVRSVFDMCGIGSLLPIHQTLADALATLQ